MTPFGRKRVSLTLLTLLVLSKEVSCYAKFGNIVCKVYEPSFGFFKICGIQAVSHTKNVLTVHFVLGKTFDDLIVNSQILKRNSVNVWQLFLYNMTVKACDLLKNPSRYPVSAVGWLYSRKYTNINHTCPYKAGEEIILKEIPSDVDWLLKRLPIDVGNYAIHSNWYQRKQLIASINATVTYSDYKKD